jgi:eukaryotic-like serine/threonine-protein kinase
VGFSVQNICGFLIRSHLMTADEMRAMHQRWESGAGKDVGDLDAFLKWLVATGYVTEYQAGLLGQGHADNFFLNQYKILERIGRGRMAGVYRAVHSLGQVVAIKVLPPSRAKSPQLLARFEREARLAMRLKHPNVVRSFQVGDAAGVHYLVMEHLEGETLDELLRRRKMLPPAEACRLAHQTLLGLQHIHEQGMVHRDIKPANLFLQSADRSSSSVGSGKRLLDDGSRNTDCVVKVLDIGLAREMFDETLAMQEEGALELTAEGVLLGTPDYLAPEQARDARRSDIRADIYSAGCVLYHMLVGQPPFPDRNLFNQIVRHASETPRPLRSFNPAVPEGLEQIVAWMMAKQPDERYPTPARAAQALEVFLLVGSQGPVREEAPQMRRYLTWLETEDPTPGSEDPTILHPPPAAPKPAPAVPVAMPAAAPVAAPVLRPVIAAPSPDEIDVELVPPSALQPPPSTAPSKATPLIVPPSAVRTRPTPRLLIGIGVAALALSCGCAGLVGMLIKSAFEK